MDRAGAELNAIAEAFSRKAEVYDAFGQDHPNLARMRRKVRRHVESYLQPGSRILELNAGTGSDAVHFAQRGYRVHATDLAPGMLASLQAKIEAEGLHPRLTAARLSFTDLDRLLAASFDCVLSNFGGLNCISDLRIVTRQLPRLLSPGGRVTWVVMPPICLWELATVLKGDFRTASRRLAREGTVAHVQGVHFRTYYFSPQAVIAAFDDSFKVESLKGLSVFTPPADRKGFARRHPRLFRTLTRLDDRLSDWPPFRGWGDFFILTMRYAP